MSECKGIIWNGWRYDNCHRQFDECGRGPCSDETKKAEAWAKHGPALLAAAKATVKTPCSHPIGMAGSPARIQWEDDCFAYGKLMKAIAACEQIEGKDDAKD